MRACALRRRRHYAVQSEDTPLARLSDLTERDRAHLLRLREQAPRFEQTPWVSGGLLSQRRIAIVTTAALHQRNDSAFDSGAGATDYRVLPDATPAAELVMSHLSVNFDRTGFQQDLNVVFPIDRLHELAADAVIGSTAAFHYSFMGAPWPPTRFEARARELAALLHADGVGGVLLTPV